MSRCTDRDCCEHGIRLTYYSQELRLRAGTSDVLVVDYAEEADYLFEYLTSFVPGGTFDALRSLFKKYETKR